MAQVTAHSNSRAGNGRLTPSTRSARPVAHSNSHGGNVRRDSRGRFLGSGSAGKVASGGQQRSWAYRHRKALIGGAVAYVGANIAYGTSQNIKREKAARVQHKIRHEQNMRDLNRIMGGFGGY